MKKQHEPTLGKVPLLTPPARTQERVPILGQHQPAQQVNAPGLTAKCEVHDSEIIEIERILNLLNERTHGGTKRVSYDAFQREIIERFQDIGFRASVAWYDTNVPGVLIPEIVIHDRIERKNFDHDQQVHEVTNDILGLGDGGVIKTNPGDFEKHSHQH